MKDLNKLNLKEKREFVSQFNLIDDTFCSVVLEDKEAAEYLLSILLNMKIKIVENKTQYSLKSLTEHSVILDILARDEKGRLINIEVNSYDDDDHARRIRYYAGMIDTANLGKKKPYRELPDLYMIYISKNDPLFGDDENFEHKIHYEIVHYVKGTDKVYDNGLHIHYFNTSAAGKSRSKLAALMRYFENSDPKNDSFGALSRRVNYFKSESKGVGSMCKIIEDYNIKTKVEMIDNLLKMGISLDIALNAAKIDRETYEKYSSKE